MTERNRTDKLEAPSNAIGKILSFIRERRYQPSERLPSERDFAEKFDTSRGAVREALAALETMRVIERRPNSGIYLRKIEESSIDALVLYAESGVPFEAKEIADVMEVRRMLEGQAVRLACTRRTADNIREINAILEETNKRLSKKQRALLQRLAAVRGRLSLCADQAAAAKWWLSMPMASVSAEGPMPKALSTRRTSPLMPGCRHQGRACPLRRARMTSNPLIVA